MAAIAKRMSPLETVREATRLLRLFQDTVSVGDHEMRDRINQCCGNLGNMDPEFVQHRWNTKMAQIMCRAGTKA